MKTWTAVALGAVAMLALPASLPLVAVVAGPLVKAATKAALLAYERARVGAAHAAEALEDLLAEARSEAEREIEKRRAEDARRTDGGREGPKADAAPSEPESGRRSEWWPS
jgi:hypothetical protein